jgi:hypothetical protein
MIVRMMGRQGHTFTLAKYIHIIMEGFWDLVAKLVIFGIKCWIRWQRGRGSSSRSGRRINESGIEDGGRVRGTEMSEQVDGGPSDE